MRSTEASKQPLSTIDRPVPELPVADVERAQQYYRDTLGFGDRRRSWGLRQFTIEDLDGNRFYFHHD